MQKNLLGKMDGTLIFHHEQGLNFDKNGLKFAVHSKCGMTCPNCMEHESCETLNLLGNLSPTGISLLAVIERVIIGHGAATSNRPSAMALLPISFDWTGCNHLSHQFFDLAPILDNYTPWLHTRPISTIIDDLVRESANWVYENQVRYRIVQVGLVSGLYCTNCDSLTIMDPILYGYHVKRSPIMRAGKGIRAVVLEDQLYLFNKSSIFDTCCIINSKELPNKYRNRGLLFCEADGDCMELKGIRIESDGDDKKVIGVLDEFDENNPNGTTTTFYQLIELGDLNALSNIYELDRVVPIGNSDYMMKSSELLDLVKTLGVSLTEENYGIGVIER